ncbi:MAG: hypothetical protein AB1656_17380 [Candidatus Omnitrophota bacterium]
MNHAIIDRMRRAIAALPLLCFSVLAFSAEEIPAPAPLIPTGLWADNVGKHPILLGSRSHLQALAKAKPSAYADIRSSHSLLADGITNAVEGLPRERIETYIQNAMKNVQRGVTDIHQDTWIWLMDAALTYDLFFDAIAPSDRQALLDWMNAHLAKYKSDENAFHNSTLSKILCYLLIAYGTWGENSMVEEFQDYALKKLYEGKVLPVLNEFSEGGGFTECGWYARGSLWHLAQALELARRCIGYDGFSKAPRFFYSRLAYELLQPYPGLWLYGAERYPVEGDGANTYGGHNEYPRHLRTILAQYFRGSKLARLTANRQRKGSNPESRLVDFLYEEDPDPPLDLSAMPPAHFAPGIGKIYARSDWTDDATWLRFECGDYWAGHQHFETGNIEIFRYEPLAAESGEYHDYLSNHSVNWLIRTIAHNCLLVFQPGEQWTNMRDGGRNAYANDGGQAKKWDWTVDTLEMWKQRREQFERGEIVAYENHSEFLYVAGDCAKAYSPSKMEQWMRRIVFIRPHTIVLFDRVKSVQPDFKKTWLLHCKNEPAIDNRTITIKNGKGRMIVRSLWPENAAIEKIEGNVYGGQTFDPPTTVLTPLANKWRIEISPKTANKEDYFLHAFFTDEPQPVHMIQEEGRFGARVGEAEILFNAEGGGTLTLAGKTYALKENSNAAIREWRLDSLN